MVYGRMFQKILKLVSDREVSDTILCRVIAPEKPEYRSSKRFEYIRACQMLLSYCFSLFFRIQRLLLRLGRSGEVA